MQNNIFHVSFPKFNLSFTINRIAFSTGNLNIYWYAIILILGIFSAFLYVLHKNKKTKICEKTLINILAFALFFGIIGARIYYVIFFPGNFYIKNPQKILSINEGGLGIYGGIIFGIISAIILCKMHNINEKTVLDLASSSFFIAQSIGRWGNFINQEAFGGPTSLPWGMLSENTDNIAVHPCFLYESLWCALGFCFLKFYEKKFQSFRGELFVIYILWYSFGRFFIENLRTDALILPFFNLRISQILSLILFISCFFILIGKKLFKTSKNKKD
jgi:phosphatidylglycerol:prolipoprotein diacylglycerol transferase